MTRDQKIAEARRLRAEGWTYPRLADHFGVAIPTVGRWCDERYVEITRRSNAKRASAKRAWEAAEAQRKRCACGALLTHGSRYREYTRCSDCHRRDKLARTAARGHQIEEWWAAGLTLNEIAGRLGWTPNHVGVEIDLLRQKGFHLPYRNRGYSKYGKAA